MNPQNTHPDRAALRAECEAAMMEVLALGEERARQNLSPRLAELFTLFPDLREEYDELLSVARAAKLVAAPIPPDWERAEQRFVAALRLRSEELRFEERSSESAAMKENKRHSVRTSSAARIFALSSSVGFARWASAAALVVAGFASGAFVGGYFFGKSDETRANNEKNEWARLAALPEAQEERLEPFLQDAHLLLIGVMSMNAECGVANPQALDAQRRRGLELLGEARSLRMSLSAAAPDKRQALNGLNQVEYALAEIAGARPHELTTQNLRRLQAETDYALCEVSSLLALRNK